MDILWLFIHSPNEGHFDCFHIWAIMNNVVISIHIQVFVCAYVFVSLGQTSVSEGAGSYGKCMFNFVRHWQTVFQGGRIILHFHWQCMRVLVPPHSC